MIPDILDDADLQAGNSLSFSSTQLATLVGSGIAGAVVSAVSSGVALAIDAGTFIISAVSLAAMRSKKGAIAVMANAAPTETSGSEHESEPARGFWQIIRSSALVQVAFFIVIVANLAAGGMTEVALPVLVRGSLNAGATGLGFLLSSFGAGVFIGSIMTGLFSTSTHRGPISLLAAIIQASVIALLPYAGGLLVALVCMLIIGIANSITNILFFTLIQQTLPRAQLGRIMSVLVFASFGSYPISGLLAGLLITHTGPAVMFPISAVFITAGALFGLARHEIRTL